MKPMKLVIAVIFTLVFALWGGARILSNIVFDREIGGYLKRAADSNTVGLAIENLEIAVKNIEASGMTSGYTNILYRTPNEDVGFWHSNLKASLQELQAVKPDVDMMTRTNILMKLRETLVDHAQAGVSVTIPPGIAIYPNNLLYMLWAVVSGLLAAVFWFFWFVDYD